jgi:hypothetical protein
MNKIEPVQILLDNSVMSYAIVAHGIRVPVEGWANKLFLIQAKPARSTKEKWLREQIEALPTVARLACEGKITVHSYAELHIEARYPSDIFGDVFDKVEIHQVSPAVERSAFFVQDIASYAKGESFVKFCQWLLVDYSDVWLDARDVQRYLKPDQIRNLREIKRYRDICKYLAPKHYADAFHLWTGEVNGLTHFLSVDRKFINAVMKIRKLTLRCIPVLPTDLLSQLGIAKRDPLPFQYGARYLLSGHRYD